MRAVAQKVKEAEVKIEGGSSSEIGKGLLVFLAISESDDDKTIKWTAKKLVNLRVFPDEEGKMNKSVIDVGGDIMLISNFTLYGDVRKGYRPNFMKSAPPAISKPLYERFVKHTRDNYPIKVADGEFGAMMEIKLINDGPVTVLIDKENE